MQIGGFRESSFIDYPGKISAVVFVKGCNFKCPYCHNGWLLEENELSLSANEILFFLKKRIGKLDGVVISGGEPTIHKGLIDFIRKIKIMGYSIKLDTNGYKPDIVKNLLDNNLLDYIAMDIKGPLYKYNKIANVKINTDNIEKSIKLIKNANIKYEFRTTLVPSLLSKEDILNCKGLLKGAQAYFLQIFNKESVLDEQYKKERTYSEDELKIIIKEIKPFVNYCEFR